MAFTGATAGLAAGAQTNDTRMDFALEPTYATPPAGNYQALRITGETFGRAQTTARPAEINSLKEVSQSVVTQVSASGTISGALSSGTFDDLIAGVMGNDWANNNIVASSTNSTKSVIQIRTDGWSGYPGVVAFLTPAGAVITDSLSSLPQSGIATVTDSKSGLVFSAPYTLDVSKSVLLIDPAIINQYSSYLTNGVLVCGDNSTIAFSGITNGNLDKTFTIRKKLLGQFLLYPGSLITQVQIQLQQAQFGTVTIDATSANETLSLTDIATAVLPAPSGNVHNSVNNFLGATINGKSPAGCVTQFTCTLARDGSANDYGMGHADACGVRTGQFTASGSIEFYFRTWDEYNAFIAGTQGQIIVTTVDDSGNGYAFMFTNAALRNGKVNSPQTNETIKASFDIEGNPTSAGGTFTVMRLSGVAPTGS